MHVVHQFLPEYTGGTEVYVADLAARLQKRGHDVLVFAGADEPGRRSYAGIDVEAVPGGLRRGPAALDGTAARPATGAAGAPGPAGCCVQRSSACSFGLHCADGTPSRAP